MRGETELERLRSLVIGAVRVTDRHKTTVNAHKQFAALYDFPVRFVFFYNIIFLILEPSDEQPCLEQAVSRTKWHSLGRFE